VMRPGAPESFEKKEVGFGIGRPVRDAFHRLRQGGGVVGYAVRILRAGEARREKTAYYILREQEPTAASGVPSGSFGKGQSTFTWQEGILLIRAALRLWRRKSFRYVRAARSGAAP
jgi:hypothetical protein